MAPKLKTAHCQNNSVYEKQRRNTYLLWNISMLSIGIASQTSNSKNMDFTKKQAKQVIK